MKWNPALMFLSFIIVTDVTVQTVMEYDVCLTYFSLLRDLANSVQWNLLLPTANSCCVLSSIPVDAWVLLAERTGVSQDPGQCRVPSSAEIAPGIQKGKLRQDKEHLKCKGIYIFQISGAVSRPPTAHSPGQDSGSHCLAAPSPDGRGIHPSTISNKG